MMNIARTQMEAGRYVQGLNLAKRAIRKKPQSKEIAWMLNTARYLMGLQYMRLKRFGKAVEFLQAVDPKFFDTKKALAEMQRRRLRLARIHTKQGQEFMNKGDYKRAFRQFEMALEFNPRNRIAKEGKRKASSLLK
jgi:tetratricopeptide (TPR) repeat protein